MTVFYVHEAQMDTDSEYYQSKIDNLRAAERSYAAGDELSSPMPPKINLQTNYSCNARCGSCPIERPTGNPRVMSRELFDSIAEEAFPTAVIISTTTIGEPLMLPWFGHLCRTAERYGVMADIVTNGMLLDDANTHDILSIAADVKISFDSVDEKMFGRLRPGCRLSTIERNLTRLIRMRRELEPVHRPTVTLQTTLMKSNIPQLPDIVRFASEHGADRVKAYYMISYSKDMDSEVLAGDDSQYRSYIDEAAEIARETGLSFEASEESFSGTSPRIHGIRCTTAWHQVWIDHDGLAYPCHSHGGFSVGDAGDGLSELWNGTRYRSIRRTDGDDDKLPCFRCGMLFERDGDTPVPYDRSNFLSGNSIERSGDGVRWSNRSRLFDVRK